MKRSALHLLSLIAVVASLSVPSLGQVAPPLGLVKQFTLLGNSGVTGSTGAGTTVAGDVGSSPTAAVTNFPPSTVSAPFVLHLTNDSTVQQAHADAITAYNFLAAEGPGVVLPAQLNGVVLTSGIYSFAGGAADLAATGTLTLNGPGIFVFQVASTLTANVGSTIAGTANACNVYWRVGTSATLNGNNFSGNVLAAADITIGAGSNVTGRAIAGAGPTGAVTIAGAGGNTVGGCASTAVVCPATTLNPAALPAGTLGTPYSQTLTGSGGVAPYGFVVTSGTLPAGFALNSASGVISGTPANAGTSNFTVTATDANGCPATRAYSLVLACPVLSINPSNLPNGSPGAAYNQVVSASGGTAPYTYAVSAGNLPQGLTLNAATGAITGTPAGAGQSSFSLTATDANGCRGTVAFALSIITTPTIPTVNLFGLIALATILGAAGLFLRH